MFSNAARPKLFLAIILFALVGVTLLIVSLASSSSPRIEPSSVTGGGSSVQNSPDASEGSFIEFDSDTSQPPLGLEFARPNGWESWPLRTVNTDGTINGGFNIAENTRLVLPDEPVTERIHIDGSNANVQVVIIGGNSQINDRSVEQAGRYSLRIRGQFKHLYIEGMLFDGIAQSDGLNMNAEIETLTIQNTFFDRSYGGNGRLYSGGYPIEGTDGLGDWFTYPDHNDTLQMFGAGYIENLFLANVVSGAPEPYGRGGIQGGKFAQQIAPTNSGVFKNVDVMLHSAPESPGSETDSANSHHGGSDIRWTVSSNFSNVTCDSVFVSPNYEHTNPWKRVADDVGCQGGVTEGLRSGGPSITKDQVGLNYVAP